jgi:hypothetical protein
MGRTPSAGTSRDWPGKAGLPPVRRHDFRHGAANLALAGGARQVPRSQSAESTLPGPISGPSGPETTLALRP